MCNGFKTARRFSFLKQERQQRQQEFHSKFHIHSNKNDLYCVIWVYIWVRLHILHVVWTIYGPRVHVSIFYGSCSYIKYYLFYFFPFVSFLIFVCLCFVVFFGVTTKKVVQTKVSLAVHRPNQCAPTASRSTFNQFRILIVLYMFLLL